jgi:integrase
MRKDNPAARIKIASDSNGAEVAPKMAVLTEQEVALLAKEVGPEYGVLLLFAAYSGLRAGEVSALRVKNADLLHREVTVEASLSDVNGEKLEVTPKNRKSGTVAIPRQIADMLADQVAGKKQADLVFPGPKGGYRRHDTFYNRVYRPAIERLVTRGELPKDKANLRFHDLRHTCASILIAAGTHPR